jgi:hypothetical protein
VTHRWPVPGRHPGPGDGVSPPDEPAEWAPPPDLSAVFVRHHAELVRLALLLVGDQPTAESGSSTVTFGSCLPGRLVSTRQGNGTWGPGAGH